MSVARYVLSGLAVIAASFSLVVAPAQAVPVVIFQDDFESNPFGVNLTPAGWTVSNGTVDIVGTGFGGILCGGGSAHCIDMDGSTNDAGDMTSNTVFTNPGAASFWTLEFDVSGNQRDAGPDSMSVTFGGVTNVIGPLAGSAPFAHPSLIIPAAAGSSSTIIFSHAGGDNIGLILDNVTLSIDRPLNGAVPEPGTLVLLGAGLASLAAAVRRRRSA